MNNSVGTTDSIYKQIELWGRAPGMLDSEAPIRFLNNLCNIALQ